MVQPAGARVGWCQPVVAGQRVIEFDLRSQFALLSNLGFDSPGWGHLGWIFAAVLCTLVAWVSTRPAPQCRARQAGPHWPRLAARHAQTCARGAGARRHGRTLRFCSARSGGATRTRRARAGGRGALRALAIWASARAWRHRDVRARNPRTRLNPRYLSAPASARAAAGIRRSRTTGTSETIDARSLCVKCGNDSDEQWAEHGRELAHHVVEAEELRHSCPRARAGRKTSATGSERRPAPGQRPRRA